MSPSDRPPTKSEGGTGPITAELTCNMQASLQVVEDPRR